MSLLYTTRAVPDALLTASANAGANNATTSTNIIDLGSTTPFSASERIMLQISTTVGTNAANNKNLNITLQHCADTNVANFVNVNIGSTAVVVIIPEVSTNFAATTKNIPVPIDGKRYYRAKIVTESAGGNPTDAAVTIKALF